jgi:hypothetical protein
VKPTLLGAAFDAGNVPRAEELYDDIVNLGPAAFMLASTIPDLELSLSLLKDAGQVAGLKPILDKLKNMI